MQKREKNQKPLSIIINFIMIIIATISILPFILMFVMSTQDNQMIFQVLPSGWVMHCMIISGQFWKPIIFVLF